MPFTQSVSIERGHLLIINNLVAHLVHLTFTQIRRPNQEMCLKTEPKTNLHMSSFLHLYGN